MGATDEVRESTSTYHSLENSSYLLADSDELEYHAQSSPPRQAIAHHPPVIRNFNYET